MFLCLICDTRLPDETSAGRFVFGQRWIKVKDSQALMRKAVIGEMETSNYVNFLSKLKNRHGDGEPHMLIQKKIRIDKRQGGCYIKN